MVIVRIQYRHIFHTVIFLIFSTIFPTFTYAQVFIQPISTTVSSTQEFNLTISSTTNSSVTTIKLLIPSGVKNITPYVKPGWSINTLTAGDTVSEIDWAGGEIPSGQADIFTFLAKTPSQPTTLSWKTYITYADGSIISWDQNPKDIAKNQLGNLYATTSVIQIVPNTYATKSDEEHTAQKANVGFALSLIGIIIASVALSIARRKTPLSHFQQPPRKIRKR